MFDSFTDRARKVMSLARQEAQRLNHDYIGTEHLLLGLGSERNGIAATVLELLGVDLRKVRVQVEQLVQPGTPDSTVTQLPFTPRAKSVIDGAIRESARLGHEYIGTGHLLLGLLLENAELPAGETAGLAAQVLLGLGLNLEGLRGQVENACRQTNWQEHPVLGAVSDAKAVTGASVPPEAAASTLFDKFTQRSRNAMDAALKEALRLNHGWIGTEHILLGLVQEANGPVAKILRGAGVDPETVRKDVELMLQPADSGKLPDRLPLTPRAKHVVELSQIEAGGLGHEFIGTGHLLLGLLNEPEGLAGLVLMRRGFNLSEVRREVRRLYDEG